MPTYPVKNTETGEQKEVVVSIHNWDQWRKDNPLWIRDWSDPTTAPSCCEIGEWKDRLKKNHPGWNDKLKRIKEKNPNSTINPI